MKKKEREQEKEKKAKAKSAALFEAHDQRLQEMMEDEGNAGFRKVRVTHDQSPSNPEEGGSDSETTFEREQNEIAERQRALSARKEKKRKA